MFKRPGHSLVNTAGAGDKFVELSVGSADRIIVYSENVYSTVPITGYESVIFSVERE